MDRTHQFAIGPGRVCCPAPPLRRKEVSAAKLRTSIRPGIRHREWPEEAMKYWILSVDRAGERELWKAVGKRIGESGETSHHHSNQDPESSSHHRRIRQKGKIPKLNFAQRGRWTLGQNSDDRARHACGQSTGNNRAQTQTDHLIAAFRSQAAQTAYQNSKAAEVRKTGERVSHDEPAAIIEGTLRQLGHIKECEEFVKDGFRAHQRTCCLRLRPRNSK